MEANLQNLCSFSPTEILPGSVLGGENMYVVYIFYWRFHYFIKAPISVCFHVVLALQNPLPLIDCFSIASLNPVFGGCPKFMVVIFNKLVVVVYNSVRQEVALHENSHLCHRDFLIEICNSRKTATYLTTYNTVHVWGAIMKQSSSKDSYRSGGKLGNLCEVEAHSSYVAYLSGFWSGDFFFLLKDSLKNLYRAPYAPGPKPASVGT